MVVPTILDLQRQTRRPDLLLVVVADDSDIDQSQVQDLPFPISVIKSERGSTLQRNAALRLMSDDDILLFLDDDFVMSADYLANLEMIFESNPEIVMATGQVLADGIHGPGLTHDHALHVLAEGSAQGSRASEPRDIYNCYGCNMALRAGTAIAKGEQFDQRLVLYGWLEDVDFSRKMAKHGRIVSSDALQGVHLGTKVGRSSGVMLGYSQIINPLYLTKKGTMAPLRALSIMFRNSISNLLKSLRPEPEVDRIGRLKGNIRALGDLLRGRLRPEEVLNLK